MINIITLIENTKLPQSKLAVEHGLSFFVRTDISTFIFDCGHTSLAWSNAKMMNIDLAEVEFVVLSHSHYDHAGGFPSLLHHVKPQTLFTGKNFWCEKFSYKSDTHEYNYKGCGFTEADLTKWNIKQVICEDVLELNSETWLIGNIERSYDFETIPAKFVCGEEKQPDNFNDEIVLVLREDDGVAIVTGCAHNGILNIVTTVKKRLNLPIHSVIGGIHLKGESSERIDKTLTELKYLGIRRLALCHCSGDEIHSRIDDNDFTSSRISTGSVIKI